MQVLAFTAPDLYPLHNNVPLSGVTVTEAWNAPTSLEATLEVARAYESLLVEETGETVPLIREQGTVLVLDDGVHQWGFLVEAAPRDAEDQQRLRIAATGIGVLPEGVPWLGESREMIRWDVFSVVRTIWKHVTDQPDTLTVTVDDDSSPVTVGESREQNDFETSDGEQVSFESGPYKLNWWSTDDLKKELDDLAEEAPFEWREQTSLVRDGESKPTFHIALGYPRLEVPEREHLHFEIGVNVSDPQAPEETEAFTEVFVLGNGEGSEKKRARAHRDDVDLHRTVKVISDQSITTNRQARKVAQDTVDAAQREAHFIETCTVTDHPAAPLTAFGIGDVITIQGETAWGYHRQTSRITEITRSVGDQSASLTLSRWR